ncbi:MAG: TIGR04211 family SH3 domain-containing protein [Nitrosomonas sp.]
MQKHVYIRILFTCLLMISTQLFAKNIQYVSDELTIPMRTGPTTSHKILKFLTSGTMVDVLDVSDDKNHTRIVLIEDESKSGWVETRLLMSQPSAREQLVVANKSSQVLKEKQATLKTELAELQKKNAELQEVQSQLENKYMDLQNILIKLRTNAEEPIRIADENEQLKQQLHNEQNKNIDLVKKNTFLGDQNIKQWFMIGAGVAIGSLILGLLITRIRWKRRDSWGDVR